MIETDVCILGGGPGGLAAAANLALHGRRVVVVNAGPLMGYGIEGAFRSKAAFEITRQYVYASLRPDVFEAARPPSLEAVLRGTQRSAEGLNVSVVDRLQRLGVEVIEGRGVIEDAQTVLVGGRRVRAKDLIIATGSRPRVPEGIVPDDRRVLTSDTVNRCMELPRTLAILGAGVIGCEYASIFAALGSEVTLVDTQPRVLGSEDPDLSAFITRAFVERGIKVLSSTRFQGIERTADGVRTALPEGRVLETGAVLLAIGRVACTDGIGLERIGVERAKGGWIPTDGSMRTNVPHVYAVGDVGDRGTPVDLALVHVAQAEGVCAAHHILGEEFDQSMDHVPYIIFTVPMIAGAGLSETAARERHGEVRVGKYPYGRNHRAHAMHPALGYVKLIVGPVGDDRILGVRVVGRDADTLIAAASILIERQLPYTYLITSIMPHPSLIECLQGAAHIIQGDALTYEEGEEYDFFDLIRRQ
ncbi:dihydrolipoyl dehydrogenase family protein [Engelhardtia mirabilis]|uniref:Dihydrolipoyl dehydrogenase n=1 Tax=Engelhardtia mirabilis TaxID=2528011 RepID=A0A518BGN2_9BACT|nr:Dihydrolipoyl dehydrogenase [Planctomycetes bacterium Pla133]QDV00474.1 Dihydrolipoyl dehydrogenase [Planctomycetes bacterium Pla86]